MKTSKKITLINRRNKILLSISLLVVAFLIISFILHVTPLKLLSITSEFAIHHYFLTSFIGFLIFVICIKSYFDNKIKINELQSEKEKAINLKISKRKARIQKFRNNISLKILALKNKLKKKDTLNNSKFNQTDVLTSADEINTRQQNLIYAMKLGNSFKQSVKIHYRISNLSKSIEAAVLFVSNEHITLKGGEILPIKSIYKVEI